MMMTTFSSNRITLSIVIIMTFSKNLFCQIGFSIGKSFVYSERVVPMKGVKNRIFSDYPYISFSLEGKLNKKVSIQNFLFKHPGSTYINFGRNYRDINNNKGINFEMYNTDLYRNDFLIKYKFLSMINCITFQTLLGASFMTSVSHGYTTVDYTSKLDGIPYKQNGEIISTGYNRSQWMPLLGLEIDIKIWKFNLFLNAVGAKGFRIIHRVNYPYTYNGVSQPSAISENRGTGIFTNIGIKTNWLQPDI
jgi:hypothetical protein